MVTVASITVYFPSTFAETQVEETDGRRRTLGSETWDLMFRGREDTVFVCESLSGVDPSLFFVLCARLATCWLGIWRLDAKCR